MCTVCFAILMYSVRSHTHTTTRPGVARLSSSQRSNTLGSHRASMSVMNGHHRSLSGGGGISISNSTSRLSSLDKKRSGSTMVSGGM